MGRVPHELGCYKRNLRPNLGDAPNAGHGGRFVCGGHGHPERDEPVRRDRRPREHGAVLPLLAPDLSESHGVREQGLARNKRKYQSVVTCISGIGKGSPRSGVRTFNLYSIQSSNRRECVMGGKYVPR